MIKRDETGFIYTPLTKKVLKISFEAHKEALDKGGLPILDDIISSFSLDVMTFKE